MVRELAIRLASPDSTEPPVIVNCMTPGACKSDFNREGAGLAKIMFDVVCAIIARSTEVGSRTLVAALEAGIESHGGYMADSKVAEYVCSYTELNVLKIAADFVMCSDLVRMF